MTSALTSRLAAHLRDHHHVVNLAELRRLGGTRSFARAQVSANRWQQVYDGVWCAYTGRLTFLSRCAAALAWAGPGAMLDRATAMRLHGLVRFESASVHLVLTHPCRRTPPPGVRMSRSRTLSPGSWIVRQNMPVVRVERALLGMALARPLIARAVISAGVQQGLTTATRLRGVLLGLGRVNHLRTVMRVLADVEGGSHSELEGLFRDLLRRARLPLPAQQVALRLNGRRLWLDAAYADLKIAIEIDGRLYHLMSEDWENDLDRQNEIVLDGWLLLRFTARAIRHHPDDVVRRVADALNQRSVSVAGSF